MWRNYYYYLFREHWGLEKLNNSLGEELGSKPKFL